MEQQRLNSCPFCGGEAYIRSDEKSAIVGCHDCFFNTSRCHSNLNNYDGKSDCIAAWNKRVPKRESGALPVVRLNSYAPKLPDECEVEVFLDEERISRMRPVKGGFMVKILAANPKRNDIEVGGSDAS